jgi:FAD dependent oxidoreductase TIGR03364
MKNYDLIVVGAGIVGLAHAYTAATRGRSVLVIERDGACLGASIRNFGFVTITGQRAGAHWRRAMRSRDVWAEIAPKAGIDVLHSGLWLTARRPAAAAVLEAFMHTEMGAGCELLTPPRPRRAIRRCAPKGCNPCSTARMSCAWSRAPPSRNWPCGCSRRLEWISPSESVTEVATPRVTTSRGIYHAERVVVCNNADPGGLFASEWTDHKVQLCQLQMLRVKPQAGFKLEGSVMGDLSLVRYEGYSALPEAAALRAQLELEEAQSLKHGIHLIAVQSADGSLVVGDSHHYGSAPAFCQRSRRPAHAAPYARGAAYRQGPGRGALDGHLPLQCRSPCLVKAPDAATRVVAVTSGSGASTAFGLAEEVWKAW